MKKVSQKNKMAKYILLALLFLLAVLILLQTTKCTSNSYLNDILPTILTYDAHSNEIIGFYRKEVPNSITNITSIVGKTVNLN